MLESTIGSPFLVELMLKTVNSLELVPIDDLVVPWDGLKVDNVSADFTPIDLFSGAYVGLAHGSGVVVNKLTWLTLSSTACKLNRRKSSSVESVS